MLIYSRSSTVSASEQNVGAAIERAERCAPSLDIHDLGALFIELVDFNVHVVAIDDPCTQHGQDHCRPAATAPGCSYWSGHVMTQLLIASYAMRVLA